MERRAWLVKDSEGGWGGLQRGGSSSTAQGMERRERGDGAMELSGCLSVEPRSGWSTTATAPGMIPGGFYKAETMWQEGREKGG
eukprot:CAMPEP_0196654880 /NCGR_PEP_ID=MMETSP1086-20130531/4621_1 /TAXON_ID=77921 /ORGANISM="Cyanoptyche  gloeocystis , Strain SAG4.97" /LENGTH=83 /DNA_ID=CAMNT_0041986897 /DNA_START=541 /DNA_END=790 /DNA_ORIENTATION=-